LHWASAKPCPEAIMQQWITLNGSVAKIRMKMDYTGESQKNTPHQEMPAMFVDYDLPFLVFEKDKKLIRHNPINLGKNLKPENITYETNWLAFVDDKDFGIGIYTPGTNKAVTYRHKGNGSTGPEGFACSYVAPVRNINLKKGTTIDYEFYITIGSLKEIRERFDALKK
ncbi:MAG: hypothetical protein ACI9E1_001539, partial [Cryomorphaceae bacterium]